MTILIVIAATLIILISIILISGSLFGGKSFGGVIRKGLFVCFILTLASFIYLKVQPSPIEQPQQFSEEDKIMTRGLLDMDGDLSQSEKEKYLGAIDKVNDILVKLKAVKDVRFTVILNDIGTRNNGLKDKITNHAFQSTDEVRQELEQVLTETERVMTALEKK